MPAHRVSTGFLDVRRKKPGGALKSKLRARVFDPEDAGGRDDRDDCERDDHLHDGEAALLCPGSAVGFHLRDYLRQAYPGPPLASAVPVRITSHLLTFSIGESGRNGQSVTLGYAARKRSSYNPRLHACIIRG